MAAAADRAEGRLRDLFEAAGASWLSLPVLQPADPFLETAGEEIRRRMFVTEGGRGERLALRPDFTIPVCLNHLAGDMAPCRYAYEGAVFRRRTDGASELLETGYEDIGRADRTAADVDALELAMAAVDALEGAPADLRLGDIGLFTELLAAMDLPQAWRRRLRRSFGVPERMAANLDRLAVPRADDPLSDPMAGLDTQLATVVARHDVDALTDFLESRFAEHGHAGGSGRSAADIARRFLDQLSLRETHLDSDRLAILRDYLALQAPLPSAADALSEFAGKHALSFGDALATFAARADRARRSGLAEYAVFYAAFGRPLDYYTGLVFEIAPRGAERPLVGGGRYDGLMQMLGTDDEVPAIGFSVRLSAEPGGGASS